MGGESFRSRWQSMLGANAGQPESENPAAPESQKGADPLLAALAKNVRGSSALPASSGRNLPVAPSTEGAATPGGKERKAPVSLSLAAVQPAAGEESDARTASEAAHAVPKNLARSHGTALTSEQKPAKGSELQATSGVEQQAVFAGPVPVSVEANRPVAQADFGNSVPPPLRPDIDSGSTAAGREPLPFNLGAVRQGIQSPGVAGREIAAAPLAQRTSGDGAAAPAHSAPVEGEAAKESGNSPSIFPSRATLAAITQTPGSALQSAAPESSAIEAQSGMKNQLRTPGTSRRVEGGEPLENGRASERTASAVEEPAASPQRAVRTIESSQTLAASPTHITAPEFTAAGVAAALPHAATGLQAGVHPSGEGIGGMSTAVAGSPREAFAALDAEPGAGAPPWIRMNAQHAETGFNDPALGWVGVRAEMAAGGVHAAVVPGSADAAMALGSHIAGLSAHLSAEHIPVASLSMATANGQENAAGQNAMQQENTQHHEQDSGQPVPSDAHMHTGDPATGIAGVTDGDGSVMVRQWNAEVGSNISVMA